MKYALIFVVLLVSCSGVFADEAWEPVTGINESSIKETAINKEVIYAASEKRLYRSGDSGRTWEVVFLARGEDAAINFIDVFRNAIYISTNKGLFKSIDGRTGWKKIFKGIGIEENNVTHAAFNNSKIYLGTKAGLFTSNDSGAAWQRDMGKAGSLSIKWIAFSQDPVFLATEKGVYKGSGANWKRVFITSTEETKYDTESTDETAIAVNPVNSILAVQGKIYLATDSGIFISEDKGETWQGFESAGLGSQKINRILFRDNLYAATDNGVFVFNDGERAWQALYQGIDADRIYSISTDNKNRIWVATNKGLYTGNPRVIASPPEADEAISFDLFSHEPTIREVQKAAIEYAEVYPEKIANWRKRANLKALLPEFSLDYDKTVTYDSGADRYYIGPYDWGASVKWDLGEIIWNDDQTSIDVRSKLMVQLRDDILDETTRAYFERRRLQTELQLSPPVDPKHKIQKELRMQELTADLDAVTGGYFSEHIQYKQGNER